VRNTGASILSHTLAVIGAGGALAGWVAIVGGVREYARFRAAGIPSPAQTASLFPRDALLGEGLSVLMSMLKVCVPFSALAYMAVRSVTSPTPPASDLVIVIAQHRQRLRANGGAGRLLHNARLTRLVNSVWSSRHTDWGAAGWIVSMLTLIGCVLLWRIFAVGGWQVAVAALLVPLAGSLFGVGWLSSAGTAALIVFVALVLDGGVAAFEQQLGKHDGEFDSVIVQRHGREPVSGFYLTRSGGDVYVVVRPAEPSRESTKAKRFAIIAIPESQVETIAIGPDYHLSKGKIQPYEDAAITTIPKPKGKHIFTSHGESTEPNPTSPSGADSSTVSSSTTSVTTNNNNHTTTTISSTNINNNSEEPTAVATQPVVQLYGAGDLMLVGNHFCFPVTAANTRETIGLVLTAPALGREGVDFAHEQVNVGPRSNKGIPIWLKGSLLRQILKDAPVLINVKISTETDSGGETTVADRVLLYGPGEAAPGRADRQEQTYTPKCSF
jgi:hypothetical protein